MEISLRCRCGLLRGKAHPISPRTGKRLVCMCKDCQTYAHVLGRAEDILDPHGGTEVFQLTPAQITLTKGQEQLRCLRLSPKGLMRWYADCCKTPVANTLSSARAPFAGLIHTFVDLEAEHTDPELVFGPILAKAMAKDGYGDIPSDAHAGAPFALIVSALSFFAKAWIQGKHQPSPFFDPHTKKATVTPEILSLETREKFRSDCGPHESETLLPRS